MSRRLRAVGVAVAAGVGLVAVVVGVPVALALLVGWPLPTALPSTGELSRALRGSDVADSTFLKAVACVVWVAWAHVALAVALEAVALGRGGVARRLPGLAGASQFAARRLLAAMAVAVAAPPPPGPPVPLGAVVRAVATDPMPAPAPVAEPARGDAGAAGQPPAWVVQRRESLWGIAERALGAGERWRDIFELNRGRPQPDGGVLTDPDRLEPGWTLLLPPDARGVAPSAAEHRVAAGDTLWEIADETLGTGERWGELFELNRGRPQPDGGALADPDLIHPGWVLALGAPAAPARPSPPGGTVAEPPPPPATRPAPAGPSIGPPASVAPVPTLGPPAPTPAPTLGPPAPAADGTAAVLPGERRRTSVPLTLVAGGLAVAGLVTGLDRLRRVQQRHRRRGRRIRMPAAAARSAEAALRATGVASEAERLDLALRALRAQPSDVDAVEVVEVRLAGGDVAVELTRTLAPGDGSPFAADGRCWSVPASVPDDDLVRQVGTAQPPLPTLVPLGSDGDVDVLVDLEAAGVLSIGGDSAAARDLVRALAVSLATAPWSSGVELLLVAGDGSGTGALARMPAVRTVASLAEALDAIEARVTEAESALRHAGVGTPLAGRLRGVVSEAWQPTVLVTAGTASGEERHRIARLAGHADRCAAVVVAGTGDMPGAWCVHVDGTGGLHTPALGRRLHALRLDDEAWRVLDELLGVATDTTDVAADDPPAESEETGACEEAGGVRVHVLGSVEVVGRSGAPVEFPRSKSLEAVAYLAVAGDPVTADALQAALWPDGTNAEGTWHQTISKARRALGAAPDGSPLFPPVHETNGRYALHPAVTTDYDAFLHLLKRARQQAAGEAEHTLAEALSLVRGEPLAGRGHEFAWRPPFAAAIEAEVVDAAEVLAEARLAAGDPRGAEWAARQGLLASPYDERLYRVLMRAADAAGNPAGVHAVLHELVVKLELDIEPLESLHPETVALFERLARRPGRGSAPRG